MATARLPLSLLLLASGACASVRPLRDPAGFIAQTHPAVVYVTHKNGAVLTIVRPHMSGDSVVGTWQPVAQPLALPLSHVDRVAAMQRDKTRTRLMIAGITVASGALVFLLTRAAARGRSCDFEGAESQGCDVFRPPNGDGLRAGY